MAGTPDGRAAQALGVRLFLAMLATQELLATYLGVRLGLYDELAAGGPATAPELAARRGLDARYVREWLEQQAVAGLLAVDVPTADPDRRVYRLPPGHAAVLTLSDDPSSMVALTALPLGGVAGALPRLLDAYRTGDGVSDAAYGADWRDGHGGVNRALYRHALARWVRVGLPGVHARLTAPGARIADLGCGAGWAALTLAAAYPACTVDGYDVDAEIVATARANARGAGLAGRVRFEVRDAADPAPGDRYDLVCLLDTLHEVSSPVDVLRGCRTACADGGSVLVLDARVGPAFTAPGDEVERFQYATSVLHCLPAGRASAGSAVVGTVLRPSVVRELATRAGFTTVAEVAVDDRFHRCYRLAG